jgi:hypothetical protein
MGQLNCQTEIVETPGLEANQMTVGRHLNVNCSGDALTGFNFSAAKIQIQEEATLAYRLFKAEPSGEGVKLDMTVYKAGEVNISELTLTDGTNQFQLMANAIKVTSVLKAPEQGQKPQEPYGPIFPVAIPIPVIYLASLGLAFALLLVAVILKIRQLTILRRLSVGLRKYDSPTAPDTQFYRSVRQSEKNSYDLSELEKAFMLYNVRSYKVPLFELSPRKALRYFKKQHPQHKKARLALDRFLVEFDELNKRGNQVSEETKHELIKKMYRYVETHRGLE